MRKIKKMSNFDAETIRTYAVQAVTDFVSNGVPLSQGIAKIASTQELNPEQIKRVVEASNTVAHLKMISGSSDRTAEFPVAKYETVLGHMVQPGEGSNLVTAAPSEAYNSSQGTGEFTKYSMDQSQLETHLARGILATKSEIEKIAYDKQIVLLQMEDVIKSMSKSDNPLEKLAEVASEKEYNILSKYFGLEKTASESLSTKLVFTDKELSEARTLVGLVKEAEDLVKSEMEKKAFVGAALAGLGRVAGAVVGKPIRMAASGLASLGSTVGKVAASGATKKPLSTDVAKSWGKIKGKANIGLNLAGGALTTHEAGSIMEQING